MTQKTVFATFTGEIASGKTLTISLLQQALAVLGIKLEREGPEGHSIKIVLSDQDRLSIGEFQSEGWEEISSAPEKGPFLVKGGTWAGEWSGDTELPSDAVNLVEGFDDYSGGYPIASTEYYSPKIKNPTHWKRVAK